MAKSARALVVATESQPNVEGTISPEFIQAEPVVTTAASVPVKTPRYAPVALIANPNAVITVLCPNPKLPGSLAHAKFACFKSGQTVTEFTAAIVAAGFKSIKARNELRWSLAHGFISLTASA
jgi:hypothetical protein